MDNLVRLPVPKRRIRRRSGLFSDPVLGRTFVGVLYQLLGLRLVWINPSPVGKR